MTELNNRLSRRTQRPFGHYRKRIVVTLEPGDMVAMRLERTRTTYRASIDQIFRAIASWHAARRRAERRQRNKLATSPAA